MAVDDAGEESAANPWRSRATEHLGGISAHAPLLPFWCPDGKGKQILAGVADLRDFATRRPPGDRGFPPAIIAFIDLVNSVGLGAALDEEHELLLRLLFRRCSVLARETVWSSTLVYLDDDPFKEDLVPRIFWYERFTGDGLLLCLQPWVEGVGAASVTGEAKASSDATLGWGSGTYEDYRRRKRAIHLALDLAHRYARALKLYWLRSPPNAKRIREGREPYGCAAAIHSGWVYWMAPTGRLQTWRGSGEESPLEPDGVSISYAARLQEFARGPELANIVVSSEARGLAKRYRSPGFRYLEGREQSFRGLAGSQLVFGVQGIRVIPFLEDINPSLADYGMSDDKEPSAHLRAAGLKIPEHLEERLREIVAWWIVSHDGFGACSSSFSPGGDILRKAHGRAALRRWGALEFVYSMIFDRDDADLHAPPDERPWGVNRRVRYRRLSAAYDLLRNTDLWRTRAWANTLLAEVSALMALYSGPLTGAPEPALLPREQYSHFGTSSADHHLTRADQYLETAREFSKGSSRFDGLALTDAFGMVELLRQELVLRPRDDTQHDVRIRRDQAEKKHEQVCHYLGERRNFTRNALRCLTLLQASVGLCKRRPGTPSASTPASRIVEPELDCAREALIMVERELMGDGGRLDPSVALSRHLHRTLEAIHSDRSRIHVLWTTLLLLDSLGEASWSSARWARARTELRPGVIQSLRGSIRVSNPSRLILLMNPVAFGQPSQMSADVHHGMGLFELVTTEVVREQLERYEQVTSLPLG